MSGAQLTSTLDRILQSVANIYRKIEPYLDAKEKVDGGLDAWSRASQTLATGELSAYDENIEKARVKIRALRKSISALAKKDEEHWVLASGANMLQKQSLPPAITWLQMRIREFDETQRVLDGQLPLMQTLKRVLEHPVGMGARMALEPTSLHGLDIIALGQIETDLRGASADLQHMRKRVQNVLNELSRWR